MGPRGSVKDTPPYLLLMKDWSSAFDMGVTVSNELKVPRLLTVKELSDKTGLPQWRIYELINSAKAPPCMRVGKTFRFRAAARARLGTGASTAGARGGRLGVGYRKRYKDRRYQTQGFHDGSSKVVLGRQARSPANTPSALYM